MNPTVPGYIVFAHWTEPGATAASPTMPSSSSASPPSSVVFAATSGPVPADPVDELRRDRLLQLVASTGAGRHRSTGSPSSPSPTAPVLHRLWRHLLLLLILQGPPCVPLGEPPLPPLSLSQRRSLVVRTAPNLPERVTTHARRRQPSGDHLVPGSCPLCSHAHVELDTSPTYL